MPAKSKFYSDPWFHWDCMTVWQCMWLACDLCDAQLTEFPHIHAHIVTGHLKRKAVFGSWKTVCLDHTKKFWGLKTISLFGTPQIEITYKTLFGWKSSRTHSKSEFGKLFVTWDTSQMFFYMQTLFRAKYCAVREHFHLHENIIWVWKHQPSPNSTQTLDFVKIVWLCDSACDLHVTCVMHNTCTTHGISSHACTHCNRPPKKESCIWFVKMVCSDHAKNFWGLKTISLFSTPQIEITSKHYLGEKVPERTLRVRSGTEMGRLYLVHDLYLGGAR